MFNLGVIVPQSNFLPNFSRDLPIACKMGLGEANDKVNLFFESGGYNEDAEVIKEKIQGMIMRENLHAVLCPLNSSLIETVSQICKAEQVALIVNTMGEDVIFESALSDVLFVNSYQLWQSAWLTGYYAANCGFKTLATVFARHEGGYGIPLAIGVGAEANQAKIASVQITHVDSSDEDCTELLRQLDSAKPDVVIAHHFGQEAINFLRDAESAKLESPLITLPTFVEDLTLNQLGSRIEGMKTISTFKSDAQPYQTFAKEFKAKSGRIAHPHIVMAYESVQLVLKVVNACEDATFESLISELNKVTISGPRGDTGFNPDVQETLSHCYVREVCKDESGQFYNKTIDEMVLPYLCHEQYGLAQKNTQKQGWVNPYLIA